jgi:exonuclease SbcC
MKPIYVKMSAFGSYSGEETVDFTDVNHGIFLITGDTGAGKTTIFDAITYALFDQTSGGKRDGEMMRSQYAKEEIRTYVELKFIYHGKTYIITRVPRQERISKRRNKDGEYTKTLEQPSVELIMPDGMPYKGKIKETNQKITEIIGLEVDQFTQIAMIAQGDFLKLLHAPSRERREIFVKIFNTRIYWRIEEELKNGAKAMSGRLEDNRKDLLREMENVRCIQGSIYETEWAETPRFSESNPEQQITLVKQIIEEARHKEAEISKTIEDNQKEWNKLITELQQAEDVNKLFVALEKAERRREELDGRKEGMNAVRNKIEAAKRALIVKPKETVLNQKQKEMDDCNLRIKVIKEWLDSNLAVLEERKQLSIASEADYKKLSPELGVKISRINELLPKYEMFEGKKTELEALTLKKLMAKNNLDSIMGRIITSTELQNKLSIDQQELKVIADSLISQTQMVDKLKERKEALDKLLLSLKELQKLRAAVTASEIEYKAAEETTHIKSTQYDIIYQQFIEGQAGILAHNLQEGCACPVCGSTSHPQIASLADTGITQSELQLAKNAKEVAEKTQKEKYDALQQVKQRQESKLELIEHEGQRILGSNDPITVVCEEPVQEALKDCTDQLLIETKKLELAAASKLQYDKNELELQKLREDIDMLTSTKETANQTLTEVEINLAAADKELSILKAELIYESKKAAQEEWSATQELTRTLEAAMTNSAHSYQALLEENNQRRGNLKTEEATWTRLSEEVSGFQSDYENELTSQGFADISAYHSSILSTQEMDELENSYQRYREDVIQNESSLKHYTEQTVGKSRIQTDAMEARKAKLVTAGTQLDEINKSVFGIRSQDEMVLEHTVKLLDIRKKAKEEHAIINRLDATANGKVGQKRLNFQTYIQRRYFKSILHEANKRLYVMSSGQFILKCRELEDLSNQGEVGLDLDVYSMVNDQTRDVKTLSGGESFMAALAMALGMADIIQNTAGSIHIDTMFIDEGFGSLSDETRMQAINILNELSEGKRLVGIISHVTELKAQIGTKLVVTKSDKGSKVRWDIGE